MLKPHRTLGLLLAVLFVLSSPAEASAQNYEMLDQRLDENRLGYSVVRLWGSHYDMGFAMGHAFSGDIIKGVGEIKAYVESSAPGYYGAIGAVMGTSVWQPAEIEDEIAGIVDGVKAVNPNSDVTVVDIKVLNTFSDWGYACRSHSTWGDFVQDPVKTISSRRLDDIGVPFATVDHHVLAAWDPGDGSVRWVNMAWPGYVTVITGVNAFGTEASLHDFGSGASTAGGNMARSVAARYILTGVAGMPPDQHTSWAQGELSHIPVATSSFINYFVPEGHGGVFTCATGGQPCGAVRRPQTEYFSGQVLITTNTQTIGTTVPAGGEFMDAYYAEGGIKTLQNHHELMGDNGMHLVTVAYRGHEDMTIWAHGSGRSDRIEVEWKDLFPPSSPGSGGSGAGGNGSGNNSGDDDDDGDVVSSCACRTAGEPAPAPWLLLALGLIPLWRRRSLS